MTRTILVTGGNRGIGKAIVAAICDADPQNHVLLGSRSVERGEEAAADLIDERADRTGRITVFTLDVASDASVIKAADALREHAPLYGIVNNAGIGSEHSLEDILAINLYGPRRVIEAFAPMLDPENGRIVNVSSASGPNFVAECLDALKTRLTHPEVTWKDIAQTVSEARAAARDAGTFSASGMGNGSAYGLSKACLNAYTIELAREHPHWTINACTPGFIETGMTRKWAVERGKSPEELGMKQPEDGAKSPLFLLLGDVGGSGWYFGSDAVRSPLDRYRSPGDPPYTGD